MGLKPTVLLVDDSLTVRGILYDLLRGDFEIVADAGNGKEALRLAEEYLPDIVVMDVTMPVLDGIQATRRIHELFPSIAVVILSADSRVETIRQAMDAGAREYLFKPFEGESLLVALRRVVAKTAGFAEDWRPTGVESHPLGGVWAFCGAAGGDGRTTLLLSLAHQLASSGARTAVVDADLYFGDVSFYLELDPTPPNLDDLLREKQYLEMQNIFAHLKQVSAGFQVLALPAKRNLALDLEEVRLAEIVSKLSRSMDYVLVDLPAGFSTGALALLDVARLIFPVSSGSLEKLKNLLALIELLDKIGHESHSIHPVICRESKEKLAPFLGRLEADRFQVVPEDARAIRGALRQQVPVSEAFPSSPYSEAVKSMLRRVLGTERVAEPPRAGFFERLIR